MSGSQTRTHSADMLPDTQNSKKYPALVLALSAILALSSFRIMGVQNFAGVDGSFEWALNVLNSMDLRFGTDIASTFGPLGFLVSPMPFKDNIILANVVSISVFIIFALAVAESLYAVRSRAKALLFFAGLYGAFWICQSATLDYRIMLTFLVCATGAFLSAQSWRRNALLIAAALLAALVLFVKFNIGVLCGTSLFAAVATAYFIKDRKVLVSGLISLAVFAVAVVGLSMGFFGSVMGFLPFMKRCFEVASPYSQSMSSFAQSDLQLAAAVAFIVSALALSLYSLLSKSTLVVPLALTGIPLLLSFKHAFIRVDNLFNFPFVALAMLSVSLLFGSRRRDYVMLAAMGTILLLFLPPRFSQVNSESLLASQPIMKGLSGLAELSNLPGFQSRLQKITEENYALDKLPDSWIERSRQAKNGFDCIPFNSFLCPANKLRWCPPPVTQLFIAFHPDLDLWTAGHFGSEGKPDYLIAEFPDVDWRHPFFTCPLSWRAIFKNYQAVELSPKQQLLLEKRKQPLTEKLLPISKEKFGPGEWVPVPRGPKYVLAKISMEKNRMGMLREIFYRTDPVFVDVAYADGKFAHFRMLPLQAGSGILLSCMPRTIEGFRDLFSLDPKQRVTYFLIKGPGVGSFRNSFDVEFVEATYH